MTVQKIIEEMEKEFDETVRPKIFCGDGSCTGLWNIECDDINHNDGRKLVVKSKCVSFINSYTRTLLEVFAEEVKACVPQGWCTKENEHKTMDATLAIAIQKLIDLKVKEIVSSITK